MTEKIPLFWCSACDLEFPQKLSRCPVCNEPHRSEPRPAGLLVSLHRNRSDKLVPLCRIHRSVDGCFRKYRTSILIFALMVVAVSCANTVKVVQDGQATLLQGIGFAAVCLSLFGVGGTLAWWQVRYGPPADLLSDGTLRLPIRGNPPRGLITMAIAAAERMSTDPSTRNYAVLPLQHWMNARLVCPDKSPGWVFVWGEEAIVTSVCPKIFPSLDVQLAALARRIQTRELPIEQPRES